MAECLRRCLRTVHRLGRLVPGTRPSILEFTHRNDIFVGCRAALTGLHDAFLASADTRDMRRTRAPEHLPISFAKQEAAEIAKQEHKDAAVDAMVAQAAAAEQERAAWRPINYESALTGGSVDDPTPQPIAVESDEAEVPPPPPPRGPPPAASARNPMQQELDRVIAAAREAYLPEGKIDSFVQNNALIWLRWNSADDKHNVPLLAPHRANKYRNRIQLAKNVCLLGKVVVGHSSDAVVVPIAARSLARHQSRLSYITTET
jgi:hypothetical protein